MKKVFVIILFLLTLNVFIFPQAYSGKGRMRGVVYDEKGNPLEGVKVKLYSVRAASGFETKTNSKGEWKAYWIRGGTWYVDFEKAGYETKKITVSVRETGKPVEIEIKLKKLEGLVLTEDLVSQLEKGNKLFNEKKYDEALKVYEKILADNPDAYVINLSIGNCYFEKGEYEKAVSYYKKVLEKDPKYTKAIVSIGNCYINMKQNDKALEWYRKVDVNKIDDPVVLYNIGVIFYNHFDYESAIKMFKKSVEINRDFADGWYQLGMSYVGANKVKEALSAFDEFLKLEPEGERAQTVKEIMKAYKGAGN